MPSVAAAASSARTSSSVVWVNRSYHSPIAENGLGVSTATTASATPASSSSASGRSDGYREHDLPCTMGAGDLERSASRASGRDPVVDDDHRPALERDHRPIAAVRSDAALELGALTGLDHHELVRGHLGDLQDVRIQDAHALFPDRAHTQLRLERHAELANDHDVEWCVEGASHFERDGHTAAGECQHHGMLIAERLEAHSERAPRVTAVTEPPCSRP